MNCYLISQIVQIIMILLVMSYNTLDTSGNEEILLNQAQTATAVGAIIWIQMLSNSVYVVDMLVLLMNLLLGESGII